MLVELKWERKVYISWASSKSDDLKMSWVFDFADIKSRFRDSYQEPQPGTPIQQYQGSHVLHTASWNRLLKNGRKATIGVCSDCSQENCQVCNKESKYDKVVAIFFIKEVYLNWLNCSGLWGWRDS